MSSDDRSTGLQTLGALCLFAGIGLWLLIVLDSMTDLPFAPATWYRHRPLWGVVGLALFAFGWRVQRQPRFDHAEWKPGRPGRRFRRLIVYSRPDCHLCDDAKDVLTKYLDYLPEIEEINIDTRRELQEQYGTTIPVVEFDGIVRFHGRVDEVLLRRLIEGTEVGARDQGPGARG